MDLVVAVVAALPISLASLFMFDPAARTFEQRLAINNNFNSALGTMATIVLTWVLVRNDIVRGIREDAALAFERERAQRERYAEAQARSDKHNEIMEKWRNNRAEEIYVELEARINAVQTIESLMIILAEDDEDGREAAVMAARKWVKRRLPLATDQRTQMRDIMSKLDILEPCVWPGWEVRESEPIE